MPFVFTFYPPRPQLASAGNRPGPSLFRVGQGLADPLPFELSLALRALSIRSRPWSMYTPIDKASRGQSCGDGMKRGKEGMRIMGRLSAVGFRRGRWGGRPSSSASLICRVGGRGK